MKSLSFILAGTNAAAKHYVIPPDNCRLIGAIVAPTVAQAAAATVQFGKEGATHSVLTANLNPAGAGDAIKAALTTDVTAAEKNQVFGPTLPIEIAVDLAADSSLGVTLYFDEYLIDVHVNA